MSRILGLHIPTSGAASWVPIKVDAQGRVEQVPAAAAAAKLPTAESSTIISALSNGTAGVFVPFPAQACSHLDLLNNTGVKLRVRKVGTTEYQVIADGQGYMFFPLTNANQIEVSLDATGTAVTARATTYVA